MVLSVWLARVEKWELQCAWELPRNSTLPTTTQHKDTTPKYNKHYQQGFYCLECIHLTVQIHFSSFLWVVSLLNLTPQTSHELFTFFSFPSKLHLFWRWFWLNFVPSERINQCSHFFWYTVELQCCINFCCIVKWFVIHM